MRRPCLRFTVRRMMFAVAFVALAFGAWKEFTRLRDLSNHYQRQAARLSRQERYHRANSLLTQEEWMDLCRKVEEKNRLGRERSGGQPLWYAPPDPPAFHREKAEDLARLIARYRRAARYPWLRVEPDPWIPD